MLHSSRFTRVQDCVCIFLSLFWLACIWYIPFIRTIRGPFISKILSGFFLFSNTLDKMKVNHINWTATEWLRRMWPQRSEWNKNNSKENPLWWNENIFVKCVCLWPSLLSSLPLSRTQSKEKPQFYSSSFTVCDAFINGERYENCETETCLNPSARC